MQVRSLARIIYTDIRQSGHRPATSSGYWIGTRTTPIPILRRSRSGYLRRAFSANFLVLIGFDKMTSSRLWYSNSSQRTDDFIRDISGVAWWEDIQKSAVVFGSSKTKLCGHASPIDSYPREHGLFPVRPRVALLLVLLPAQGLDAKPL